MIQDPILLVDDESNIRESLKESLEMDGYAVDTAESATEALAVLERRFYPVVLTDLNMPGGPTGFDLIAAVKARDPRTLCIVLTGYASVDIAITAVKQGAYDFVQKPFKLYEVEAVLNRALEHARLVRQLETYQKDLEARVTSKMLKFRAFRNEVEHLDDALVAAQSQSEERLVVLPFMQYLQSHFGVSGCAYFRVDQGEWRPVCHEGFRSPGSSRNLPLANEMQEAQEWVDKDGYAESFLVPLRVGGDMLGVVVIGFDAHSAFLLDDPVLLVWKRHLEAVLMGWRRARLMTEADVRRALRTAGN